MELRSSGKTCELCILPAAVHCPADEASLCWHCDARVHAANFLVARHWRQLFCSSCGALTESVNTGSRIEPKRPCCRNCLADAVCTGESYGDDEGCEVVASPSRDSSIVSSCQSESSRTSGGSLSVKRSRYVWKQVGSARWNYKSTGSRRREPKLASQGDTEDEASCESNVLLQPTWTTASNADHSESDDLIADSEEVTAGVFTTITSLSNGSLCEDRWHRKRKSLRRTIPQLSRAHVKQ